MRSYIVFQTTLLLVSLLLDPSLTDAKVVHVNEPKLLFTSKAPEIGAGNAVTISPDGAVLYSTSMDGTLSGFDPLTGDIRFQFKPPELTGRSTLCQSGVSFFLGNNEQSGTFAVYAVTDESLDGVSQKTRVIAVRHPSGEKLWISKPLEGAMVGTPKVSSDGHHVFLNHNIRRSAGVFSILLASRGGSHVFSAQDFNKPYAPLGIIHNPTEGYFPGGEGNTNDLLMWSFAPKSTDTEPGKGGLFAFQFPPFYGGGTAGLFVHFLSLSLNWMSVSAPVLTRDGYGLYFGVSANRFRAWIGERGDVDNAFTRSATFERDDLGRGQPREQPPYNTPTLSKDGSMVYAGLANSQMAAFQWNLNLAWKIPLKGFQEDSNVFSERQEREKSQVRAEVIVSNDNKVVYFTESAGWLHAVRASDGLTIWEESFEAPLVSEISLSPDGYTLYVGDAKGNVTAWTVGQQQPICNLCDGGSVPVLTDVDLNIPGLGTSNCMAVMEMGKQGKITTENCYTLQMIARNPCGCEPASPPTTQPSVAPISPPPTTEPTPSPTTAVPTVGQTAPPTELPTIDSASSTVGFGLSLICATLSITCLW